MILPTKEDRTPQRGVAQRGSAGWVPRSVVGGWDHQLEALGHLIVDPNVEAVLLGEAIDEQAVRLGLSACSTLR